MSFPGDSFSFLSKYRIFNFFQLKHKFSVCSIFFGVWLCLFWCTGFAAIKLHNIDHINNLLFLAYKAGDTLWTWMRNYDVRRNWQ